MARSFPGAEHGLRRTAKRLSAALLGYFLLVTLVITLSPFDFTRRSIHVTFMVVPRDVAANILLFLPIGFLMRSLGTGTARSTWVAVAAGAIFSTLIESAQIFLAGRFVSPVDILTNTTGAALGIVVRERLERWAAWDPRLASRVGLDIPLVGLLYLLIPQLWLSSVGVGDDAWRSATTLLLGVAGSVILVALHRHGWPAGTSRAARMVVPVSILWFGVGAVPGLAASPRAFAAIAVTVAGLSMLLWRRPSPSDPRFEVVTLRAVLPILVGYLLVAAWWPPLRGISSWHGALGFADRLNDAGIVDLLILLERVGGFTVLGYAMAEWRGRRELGLVADLPGVTATAVVLAFGLEVVEGWLVGPGASLIRAALSVSGAVYGVAVYHLARAHVRALRSAAATPLPKLDEAA